MVGWGSVRQAGPPARLPDWLGGRVLLSLRASHDEEQVGEPVHIAQNLGIDRFEATEADDLPLGAPTNRPREVQLGGASRSSWEHEILEGLKIGKKHRLVLLQAGNVRTVDAPGDVFVGPRWHR